jgi:transposase
MICGRVVYVKVQAVTRLKTDPSVQPGEDRSIQNRARYRPKRRINVAGQGLATASLVTQVES